METAALELIADHLAVPIDRVRANADLQTDLGADSLDIIELAIRFEDLFDIRIGDEEAEACRCVGDAIAMIRAKISAGKDPVPAGMA